ncbi:hypothetical protein CBM2629_A150233 [Cupriavidus taiwanensis]|nr:hypothetical protein CBM2629_A150233 [Cupriavidus taiwanensis]
MPRLTGLAAKGRRMLAESVPIKRPTGRRARKLCNSGESRTMLAGNVNAVQPAGRPCGVPATQSTPVASVMEHHHGANIKAKHRISAAAPKSVCFRPVTALARPCRPAPPPPRNRGAIE